MGTVFDAPNERGDLIIHNRGGEAFISGLEEYLIRNQNETKTMEEIIYEFDQMRPTVRLRLEVVRTEEQTDLLEILPRVDWRDTSRSKFSS